MLDWHLLRPEMLAGLASRLRDGVRGPSRTQGVCSPGISASCSHCRPPAIHGRLSAHPLCARRAVAMVGSGNDRRQQQQLQQLQQQPQPQPQPKRQRPQQGTQRSRRQPLANGRAGQNRKDSVRQVWRLPGPRGRWCPVRAQGGCPEPAMDGRRPEVGAGQRRFRLGIPPASAPGRRSPKNTNANIPPVGRRTKKRGRLLRAGPLVSRRWPLRRPP